MATYPQINSGTAILLRTLKHFVDNDPLYFDRPECPYDDDVKEMLRKPVAIVAGTVEDLDEEDLENQIKRLMRDLEGFNQQLGNADHSERLQYYKTKTVLIEKLVTIQERILNLKELSEFRSIVIDFISESCTKDQTTAFMQRLDGVFGVRTNP